MRKVLYFVFVVFVGLTNPINLKKDKIMLDLYTKKVVYLDI